MTKPAPIDGPTLADAELMAIANACIEAARAREVADNAAEKAEATRQPLAPPAANLKRRRDPDRGVATPYCEAQIGDSRLPADCWASSASGVRSCADPALEAAADRHEELLRRLVFMPALTPDGIVAKARAFDSLFGDDDALARTAESDLEAFGPNESVLARALARDLLRLVRASERKAINSASRAGPTGRDDSRGDISQCP